MPLTIADITLVIKHRAYKLGVEAGSPLLFNTLFQMLEIQIAQVNKIDTDTGSTLADTIQADLARLETLDGQIASSAGQGGLKKADVLEWFGQDSQTQSFRQEYDRIRERVALILSQSFGELGSGVSYAYRG